MALKRINMLNNCTFPLGLDNCYTAHINRAFTTSLEARKWKIYAKCLILFHEDFFQILHYTNNVSVNNRVEMNE